MLKTFSGSQTLFGLIVIIVVVDRDEHWTRLGLDWIRTMTNFVELGLGPDCKLLHKFRIRTAFGLN